MPFSTRPFRSLLGCAAVALALCGSAIAPARADEIGALSHTLRTAKLEKERLAAAVAIGRLRDPRTRAPLLAALGDDSALVRAVAATALGHLGDQSALPALQKLRADPDHSVRKRAAESILLIQQRSTPGTGMAAAAEPLPARFQVAAREQPRVGDDRPPMHVVIKSVTDHSGAQASALLRKRRADKMRSVLTAELASTPEVVLDAGSGDGLAADRFSIDGTITKFHRRVRGPYVEVLCEIQISVYGPSGKMLSFVSGGAFVQVPAQTFQDSYEPEMRLEALEGAVRGLHPNLIAYLNSEREK